jgi:hypothetical protein
LLASFLGIRAAGNVSISLARGAIYEQLMDRCRFEAQELLKS